MNVRGGTRPRLSCGRSSLYSRSQSSVIMRTWSTDSNTYASSTESKRRFYGAGWRREELEPSMLFQTTYERQRIVNPRADKQHAIWRGAIRSMVCKSLIPEPASQLPECTCMTRLVAPCPGGALVQR